MERTALRSVLKRSLGLIGCAVGYDDVPSETVEKAATTCSEMRCSKKIPAKLALALSKHRSLRADGLLRAPSMPTGARRTVRPLPAQVIRVHLEYR